MGPERCPVCNAEHCPEVRADCRAHHAALRRLHALARGDAEAVLRAENESLRSLLQPVRGRRSRRWRDRAKVAGQWVVDFADGDGGWNCDDAADATHFATVLQAVMNRHLAAAREEGRREALRIAGLLGHGTERVRLAEQGHDALALILAVGEADDRHGAAVAELHRRFPDLSCTRVTHHRGTQWGDVEPTPGGSGLEWDVRAGVHYVLHDDPAGPHAVSAVDGPVLDVSPDVAGVIDGSGYGATMHLFDKRWRDDAVVTALVKAQEARYGAEVAAENAARAERAKTGGT